LPPLNKNKDFADPKLDQTWALIPCAFSAPVIRKSLSGEVYTYDGHISPCVMRKMKESSKNFQNILHYIITKFQNHVKDMFFPLHKRSLKLIKRHYKHPQNSKSEIVKPFVLPEHFCRIKYKEMQTKYQKKAEEMQAKEPKLSDVKVTDSLGGK
jgi:hypothetical protein